MRKRRSIIISLLACICFFLIVCSANSVSATNAPGAILLSEDCSLSVTYAGSDTAFSDVSVSLYKVADVSADFQYSLTADFLTFGLNLNGIESTREWDIIRSTLESYVIANRMNPVLTNLTASDGTVVFEALEPGLYFLPEVLVEDSCVFASVLVALPGLVEDGSWNYDVIIHAKPGLLPPPSADDVLEYSVLKLWRDEGNTEMRPQRVEVDILKDGVAVETVVLSEENHWTYQWDTEDDGAVWSVIERNVPEGYTMTVEERTATFVITNTSAVPTPPDDSADKPGDDRPGTPPKTGDSASVLQYIVLLCVSGMVLVFLGFSMKKEKS